MDKVGGGCSGASEPPCRGGQILQRLTTSWQWAPTAAPAPCGPSGDPESSAGFSWSSCLMVVLSTVLSQGERKQSISEGLFKSCVSSCRGGGWGHCGMATLLLHPAPGERGSGARLTALRPGGPACRLGADGHQLFLGSLCSGSRREMSRNGLEICICSSTLCSESRAPWEPVLCPSSPSAPGRKYDMEKSPMRLHFH